MKKLVFYSLMIGLTVMVCGAILHFSAPWLRRHAEPTLRSIVALSVTEEQRAAIYNHLAANSGFIWDTVPDPLVARLGKRDFVGRYGDVEVRFNSAGLRSETDFTPKEEGVFRILCLGDSMTFGLAGSEQDRYCDQIEDFYRDHGLTVDGKRVESYAVGIGSWTLVQEATYLGSRLTAYAPDVILQLTVANDITDIHGVTGAGVMTNSFSPEHRNWGSAFFSNQAGIRLGDERYSSLTTGLGPESRARWKKAMAALERLVTLQKERGGKILCGVLYSAGFNERFKKFYLEEEIDAPLLEMSYFRENPTYRLPHDDHPNRKGHAVLAAHYLNALDKLGWINLPEKSLPELDPRLSLEVEHPVDPEKLAHLDTAFINASLRSELDFGQLGDGEALAILGGIAKDRNQTVVHPWSSLKSGWLMRRTPEGGLLHLEVFLPERIELFPFFLKLYLDGEKAGELRLASVGQSGRHIISAELPPASYHEEVVEILLETRSYHAEIVDPFMKSFQLISAKIGPPT